MTTRDKHITQKKKEIEKITRQQARLGKQALRIANQPHKRLSTLIKRAGKVVALITQARSLEIQKQIIIARPIPKVDGFAAGGLAMIGESSFPLFFLSVFNFWAASPEYKSNCFCFN